MIPGPIFRSAAHSETGGSWMASLGRAYGSYWRASDISSPFTVESPTAHVPSLSRQCKRRDGCVAFFLDSLHFREGPGEGDIGKSNVK